MRTIIAAVALLTGLPAVVMAGPPGAVGIVSSGTFDANRIYSAVFTASGAINDEGNLIDVGIYTGEEVHITSVMATSDGEYITLAINGNHVSGTHVLPTWCSPPASIPPGTVLRPQAGNWRVLSGTGKYATLQGTGSWAAWVVFDPALGVPVSANDCLSGDVHYIH